MVAANSDTGQRPTSSQRIIVVLGMHRSGTSAWARALRVFGAALGTDLLPAHPCNPKGFFEDEHVYAFNKNLLAHMGRRWHTCPPPDAADLRALAAGAWGAQALALLREKMGAATLFGLKDPRMSTLMPFWRPVLARLPARVHCIVCLRHPDSVAHSLLRRDAMPAEHSHALWAAHTLGAITGSAGLPRTVVSYEALLQTPEAQLRRLGRALQLEADPTEERDFLKAFLDTGLCHHRAAGLAAGTGLTAAGSAPAAQPGVYACLARHMYAALRPERAHAPDLESPATARLVGACLRRFRQAPPPDCAFPKPAMSADPKEKPA